MLMMRALWGLPQPTQKTRAAGPVAGAQVLMMLAGWPPGVVHGGPGPIKNCSLMPLNTT